MGLVIRAFAGLKFSNSSDPNAPPPGYPIWIPVNPDFPGREAPLREGWYSVEKDEVVWLGSYTAYSAFREAIALPHKPEEYWNLPEAIAWPFHDLINFTDCDGTIGPSALRNMRGHRRDRIPLPAWCVNDWIKILSAINWAEALRFS